MSEIVEKCHVSTATKIVTRVPISLILGTRKYLTTFTDTVISECGLSAVRRYLRSISDFYLTSTSQNILHKEVHGGKVFAMP